MGDIGEQLRQARHEAGLSLDQISARTKIKKSFLGAIEREDFEQLPRGVFRRGFIRAYAREVCLDAEAIVQEYMAEFEPSTSPSSALVLPADRVDSELPADNRRRRQLLMVTVLLLAVLALWMYFKDSPDLSRMPEAGPPAVEGGESGVGG
jgi:cytoskeleton protein RodZ